MTDEREDSLDHVPVGTPRRVALSVGAHGRLEEQLRGKSDKAQVTLSAQVLRHLVHELRLVREVLGEDLKTASERVLELELENVRWVARIKALEAHLAHVRQVLEAGP